MPRKDPDGKRCAGSGGHEFPHRPPNPGSVRSGPTNGHRVSCDINKGVLMDKTKAEALKEAIAGVLGADAMYLLLVETPDGESVNLVPSDVLDAHRASLMMLTVLSGMGVLPGALDGLRIAAEADRPETRGPSKDN